MLRGAEEDGDGEVDVLVNVDGRMGRRKGTITPLVDEEIVSEEHVLMNATPFSCRFMVLHQDVNDIVFTGRPFLDDGAANEREDPRKDVQVFSRSPGSLG